MRTGYLMLVTFLWAGAVLAVLTWQSATYRGLVAQLGELEFSYLDVYYPLGTIFALLLLFVLPLLTLLGMRLRRRRRWLAARGMSSAVLLSGARYTRNILLWLALAPVIAALVLLAIVRSIPGEGAVRAFVPTSAGDAVGTEGPAAVKGVLRLSQLGMVQNGIFRIPATQITQYYAPITAAGGPAPVLQAFSAVDQSRPSADRPVDLRGILVDNALPGPVRQLYVDAGYHMSKHPYVLYPSIDAARAPTIRTIKVLLTIALLLALLCGLQQLTVRRLRRAAKKERGGSSAPV